MLQQGSHLVDYSEGAGRQVNALGSLGTRPEAVKRMSSDVAAIGGGQAS